MLRTERIGYWGDNGWKNCSKISPGKSSPKRKDGTRDIPAQNTEPSVHRQIIFVL